MWTEFLDAPCSPACPEATFYKHEHSKDITELRPPGLGGRSFVIDGGWGEHLDVSRAGREKEANWP